MLSAVAMYASAKKSEEWEWKLSDIAGVHIVMCESSYQFNRYGESDFTDGSCLGDSLKRLCRRLNCNHTIESVMRVTQSNISSDDFNRQVTIHSNRKTYYGAQHREPEFYDDVISDLWAIQRLVDDYFARYVITLGGDTYDGGSAVSVMNESHRVVLSNTPEKDKHGYIMMPPSDEISGRVPVVQINLAVMHLLRLNSMLGREMPSLVDSQTTDTNTHLNLVYAAATAKIPKDMTGNTDYENHCIIICDSAMKLSNTPRYQYAIICLPYKSGVNALRAYITFLSYFECSISMSKDVLTDTYYIHGAITDTRDLLVLTTTVAFDPGGLVDDVCISNPHDYLVNIKRECGMNEYSHGVYEPVRRGTLLIHGGVGSSHYSTQLANEPFITKASALCTKGSSKNQLIWAWCLFNSALYGPRGNDTYTPSYFKSQIELKPTRDKTMLNYIYGGLVSSIQLVKKILMDNPFSSPTSEIRSPEDNMVPDIKIPSSIATLLDAGQSSHNMSYTIDTVDALRAEWTAYSDDMDSHSIMEFFQNRHEM